MVAERRSPPSSAPRLLSRELWVHVPVHGPCVRNGAFAGCGAGPDCSSPRTTWRRCFVTGEIGMPATCWSITQGGSFARARTTRTAWFRPAALAPAGQPRVLMQDFSVYVVLDANDRRTFPLCV